MVPAPGVDVMSAIGWLFGGMVIGAGGALGWARRPGAAIGTAGVDPMRAPRDE